MTNSTLIRRFLAPSLPSLLVATLLSALLGVAGAVLGALIGPCVQIISSAGDALLTFTSLLGPRLGEVVTRLIGRDSMSAAALLEGLPWILIALAAIKGFMGAAQWFLFERAGERASLAARGELASAYLGFAPTARRLDEGRRIEGQLSSAVTSDVRLMREYVVHFYGGMPRVVLEVVFFLVTMILLSPKLTLIFLLGVLPAGAAGAKVGRVLRRRAARALADYSDLSEWLQQRLLGIETIKHYRTEQVEIAKMRTQSQALYEKFLRAARAKARTSPMLEAFAVCALVIVLGVALYDVSAGNTTGSVQLSFLSTVALLTQSAGKLGRYLNSNREGAAAIDRLRTILEHMLPARLESVTRPSTRGGPRVVCRELEARYAGSGEAALRGLTLELNKGKIYCVAGPSGAGKSTLFNTILGLMEPTSGELTIESPRNAADEGAPTVCYMPQKVLLAPDTVGANVAYPLATWDTARVSEALAKVEMTKPVEALPQGVDTLVGEGGHGLSGGQAQRILLARLWYHRSPIVLVDEGTSALDPEVERTVHDLLRQLADRGSVVVTIAHRASSAEIADELFLLSGGTLVAQGAPKTVMASSVYRNLLGVRS